MILLTGSAGKTGRAIIQTLVKSGENVRALAHRSDQVARLQALGVDDVPVGDMLDPDSVVRAVQGVRAIYHIAPNVSPDEVIIGKTVISAAQSAKVEHLVFHSVLYPQIEAMPHHWQKLRVEELLVESGLPFTILQPTVYMQNVLAHWDEILQNGIYPLPYSPETRLSLVDLEDVAQVAAMVLTESGHQGATYELVGSPALSQTEVAELLSKQLGRPVAATLVPLGAWERDARASGLGDYQVVTLIKMFSYYERYGFAGNANTLTQLLRRQPASLEDFVRRAAARWENAPRVR
jgi:NAD(P)H dehydrogenase (quinone)